MNKALENSLMRLLAMGNLIEPLARLQGEIRFVNEFKFENQNINISDEKAIKGLGYLICFLLCVIFPPLIPFAIIGFVLYAIDAVITAYKNSK